jgi:hypothetical protein
MPSQVGGSREQYGNGWVLQAIYSCKARTCKKITGVHHPNCNHKMFCSCVVEELGLASESTELERLTL